MRSDLGQKHNEPGNVPIPDPSVLTTEALAREIKALRDLVEEKLKSLERTNELVRGVIETRIDGMDKAITLLQDASDKFPAVVDEKIASLRAVHGEKFASIEKQFQERDIRTDQAAGAVKIAVDAALQAQKEAASEQSKSNQAATMKSEAATTKLIDAQAALIANLQKAFDDKITDVKDRITRIEGTGSGMNALWGYVIGAIGLAMLLYNSFKP